MKPAIEIRGRSIKIIGFDIIKVPIDSTCVISGFHINGNIIKNGEISFIPKQDDLVFILESNKIWK